MPFRDRIFDAGRRAASFALERAGEFVAPALEIDPVPQEIAKAEGDGMPTDAPTEDPSALFFDPYILIQQMGYKDKPTMMSYGMLAAVVTRIPIVRAIIQTRLSQVSAFARPPQDIHQTGFKIRPKDKDAKLSPADRKFQQNMAELMLRSGVKVNGQRRDGFEHFLKKFVRDSAFYDQSAFEIVKNRRGLPAAWYAVDASTIRLSDNYKGFVETDPEAIRYVQVYNQVVINEWKDDEMAFMIRNPATNIWNQGYGECLHPDSRVQTDRGLIPIQELSDRNFNVVINGQTHPAKAWKTGVKRVFNIKLNDHREIKTSPDHRLLTVGPDGCFEWVRTEDLEVGQTVLSDVGGTEGGASDCVPYEYTPDTRARSKPWSIESVGDDLWEILGWLVGDGNFRIRNEHSESTKQYGMCTDFMYAKTEAEERICEEHRKVLRKYGLPSPKYNGQTLFHIKFHHEGFGRWLLSLGFIPTSRKLKPNCLPEAIFRAPASARSAFLRGLFSADGGLDGKDNPILGCTDFGLQADAQRLLWSLGIRSRWWSGRKKRDLGFGAKMYDHAKLYVYDKEEFFDKVGFLHPHKQPALGSYQGTRADTVDPKFAGRCAKALKDRGLADRRVRGLLEEPPRWGVTRKWLRDRLPGDLPEYRDLRWHHATVEELFDTGEEIEMYDVEVQSNEHAFVVDGIVVHNSEIEMLVKTMTQLLWASEYNSRQFSQGTMVKGLVNIKGTVNQKLLRAFRREWLQMVSGVSNSWRTPILNTEEIQYIPFDKSNRDMEYSAYFDFLLKVTCAVMLMNPSEVNFTYGNSGQQRSMFESGNKQKLVESKDKGLKPILRSVATSINDNIIERIDPEWELIFYGLEAHTPAELADLNTKRGKTTHTVNELREEQGKKPHPDGDIILDPTFVQYKMAKEAMAAGGGEFPAGEETKEAEAPTEEELAALLEAAEEEGDEEAAKSLAKSFKLDIAV